MQVCIEPDGLDRLADAVLTSADPERGRTAERLRKQAEHLRRGWALRRSPLA